MVKRKYEDDLGSKERLKCLYCSLLSAVRQRLHRWIFPLSYSQRRPKSPQRRVSYYPLYTIVNLITTNNHLC